MTAPVQVGDVLAGKYRVERVLGVGGMGVVVAATHLKLDQLVALKFMLPEVLSNTTAVERFLREARAVVRLKGEHVARVLDVGTLDTGAPYIVMEYLEGEDLGGTLGKRGTLAVADACAYLIEASEAMAEAHAQGIVHRDLKPQNLFLTQRPDGTPFVKVLDFGISKSSLADAQGGEVTHTSAMMGSPAYMSPEQIKSAKDVDARTDIWALGVILYQLVSGRVPFEAATMVELCIKVMHEEPAPLVGVPVELAAVVARCLRKDRDDRYANIAELVADLVRFVPKAGDTLERVSRLLKVTPRPSASLPIPIASAPQPAGFATTLGSAAGMAVAQPPRPPRRWLAVAVGAGVVAVAAIVFAVTRPGSSSTTPTTAVTQPPPVVTPDAAPSIAPPDAAPVAISIDAAAAPVVVTTQKPRPTVKQPPRPPPVVVAPPVVVEQKPPPVTVTPDAGVPEPPKRDPFERRH